jgi:Mrp family chromosome partitioning ATPase
MNLLIEKPVIMDVPDVAVKMVKPMIEFFTPSQLSEFIPPEGFKLVGDYHIQRSSPFVIGGAPGVGKSRGAVALAVAGARRVGRTNPKAAHVLLFA